MTEKKASFANLPLKFDEHDIQDKLDEWFPLEKRYSIFKVRYHHPEITLPADSNHIDISLQAEINVSKTIYHVLLRVQSGIRYDDEFGAFYLDELKIHEIGFSHLPAAITKLIAVPLQTTLSLTLQRYPVFKWRAHKSSHRAAHAYLRNVTIKNRTLTLELGKKAMAKKQDKIEWSPEAKAMLQQAPFFIRPLAKRKIERAAEAQQLTVISADFVDKIKRQEMGD